MLRHLLKSIAPRVSTAPVAVPRCAFSTARTSTVVSRPMFAGPTALMGKRATSMMGQQSLVSRGLGQFPSVALQQTTRRAVPSMVRTHSSTVSALQADKALGGWLLGVGGAVFVMVVLGGVTRLTRSGLSMVDWRPQGSMLPSSDEEWQKEFDKYKAFPEFELMNKNMTLEEFKKIYFMEWFHRMWGRMLGVVFGVPLVYFVASGRTKRFPNMNGKLVGLLAMGGAQGLVGWWMVKSGLEKPERNREPRVSPYRLTAHLAMATALYSGLIWSGLQALYPNRIVNPSAGLKTVARHGVLPSALAAVTLLSGAFVAGNDAGRAYNDWPLYAGNWIPAEIWDETLEPKWRNFLENTATVQFDHRNLAYLTTLSIAGLFAVSRRPNVLKELPPSVRKACHALIGMVSVQVALGITTLMTYVPVSLGATHQAGALTLWTIVLYFQHALRYVR